ncbi:MAG TPA: hypothetical protein VFS90_24385 [Pyrinomonadaceae bacterium]|nr:hypothetical protein [Pyrinomonadaceae bacterium]
MISNLSSKESGCGCGGGSTSGSPCGCGGAGCGSCVAQGIVRPRFFAGQLLTEDDLQLLSDYVGQKNRLHNRHLFGAGVVCGLEVACDPCGDGRVIVHPGYAIDCCGNDLSLSCPQVVDLNALVRDLRKDDCVDPCPEPKKLKGKTETPIGDDTPKPNFRFCLYIRYCEKPTDPVTPYSTGEDCVQVGCEPTRIREGVTFELRCVDPHMARNPLIEKLCLVLGDLDKLPRVFRSFKRLPEAVNGFVEEKKKAISRAELLRLKLGKGKGLINPDDDIAPVDNNESKTGGLDPKNLLVTKADFDIVRNWLLERLNKSQFITDCTLKHRVYNLSLPRLQDQTEGELGVAAENTKDLAVMFIDYLRGSVSRVLNPACSPCEDPAVLLACLDWEECEVKRICNMERTYVLSPAALRYWVPPIQLAGNLLEKLTCVPWEDLPKKDDGEDLNLLALLREEVERLIKDSLCGISDKNLEDVLDRVEEFFGGSSDDDETMNVDMSGVAPPEQPAPQKGDAIPVNAAIGSTPAPAASKASAKKTSTKSGKKGSIKTALKNLKGATGTSKTTGTAKPVEAQPAPTPAPTPAATPVATPAATPTPAADTGSTTTPKGEEK